MSKVPQEKNSIFFTCVIFSSFNVFCLLTTFGKKSSDFLVCAHKKVDILIIENKNDSFIVLKTH